jgi:hypothetical protein
MRAETAAALGEHFHRLHPRHRKSRRLQFGDDLPVLIGRELGQGWADGAPGGVVGVVGGDAGRTRLSVPFRGATQATLGSTPQSPVTSTASTTKNASIPAWAIIPRSSSNAWPMPSKVSTKSDEDHGVASPLRAQRGAETRGR